MDLPREQCRANLILSVISVKVVAFDHLLALGPDLGAQKGPAEEAEEDAQKGPAEEAEEEAEEESAEGRSLRLLSGGVQTDAVYGALVALGPGIPAASVPAVAHALYLAFALRGASEGFAHGGCVVLASSV